MTGVKTKDGSLRSVAAFSWNHNTGTLKKRKHKVAKGPLKGHSPKGFRPRYGGPIYTEQIDVEIILKFSGFIFSEPERIHHTLILHLFIRRVMEDVNDTDTPVAEPYDDTHPLG